MSVLDFFGEEDTRITQLVYDISGSNANDQLGHSISIGLSGEIIAIGAPTSSQGGTERGLVRVYQKLTVSGVSSWNQLGTDLAGSSDNDQFGHSVDLNGDGTILAVGTKNTSNSLLVYNYDGSSWNQYGNTINLDNNTAFETSISHITKGKLNYDGTKLIALNHNLGSTTTTTVTYTTVTHTSPYVTYGCTNNWDFRTVNSVGVTDDIGGVNMTYEAGESTSSAGSSSVANGFYVSWLAGSVQQNYYTSVGMKVGNGFTYGGSNLSFEFYVRLVDMTNWSRLFRFENDDDGAGSFFELARRGTNNEFNIIVNGSSSARISTSSINNQWVHLVLTFSGGTVKLYKDGTLENSGSLTNPGTVYTTNNPFWFTINGYHHHVRETWERGMTAYWRYFRYYHGKTLSASEVTDLYNDRDDTSTANARDGTAQEGTVSIPNSVTTTEYIQNDSVESFEYSSTDWSQVGNTIQSTSVNDISGGDIAINDSGNTIAIGYPEGKSAIPSTYTYTVTAGSVFEFYGEEYTSDTANPALSFKRGSTYVLNINTTSFHPFYIQTTDNGGSYDSANVYSSGITNNGIYDGTITFVVPMDAPDTLYYRCSNHGNMGNSISITSSSSKTGIAKVFQYNTTDSSWNQVGSNIDGSGENDFFGSSIAMDSSGEFIAVGGPFAGDASAGHVKVYQNVNNTWNQAGNKIQGSADNDQFGSAVDMNSDGKVIVVGAKNADSGKGSATVYQYKNTVTGYNTSDLSWNRIGAGITGDSAGDFVGTSVGIIREGTEFSVGAPGKQVDTNDNAGTVESYTFDYEKISDTEPRFTQILTPILGTAANDRMGEAVVTSLSGDVIAISAPNNSGGGVERGLVRVYQKGDSSWTQLGSDLTGTNDNDQFGSSLCINADGTILGVGSKNISNKTIVYKYDTLGNWSLYGNTIENNVKYPNTSFTTITTTPGLQLGSAIVGEAEGDKSGKSISLSSDGTIVAIGADENDSNGSKAGHVRVWQRDETAAIGWTQIGDDLDGEAAQNYSSSSVSLSSDGTILAIGARNYKNSTGNLNYAQAGHCRVYKYSNSAWTQLGDDIVGAAPSINSGNSVSLSSDGSIVAIGSYKNDSNGFDSGQVRVWQYSTPGITGGSWAQIGGDINGEARQDYFGYSVSLSSDGTIVAAGAYENDGNGNKSGHVRIFQYSNSAWTQMGDDIDGNNSANKTYAGWSVSLSSNGNIVAIGAKFSDLGGSFAGNVRVYQYSNSAWTQIGDDINGGAGDSLGTSVSLSGDGSILAIGIPNYNSSNGYRSGTVTLYQYSNSAWTQLGNSFVGENAWDEYGFFVSLSSNGTIVAIGAYENDGNGNQSGHVRVFETGATAINTFTLTTLSASTKPKFNKEGNKLTILNEQHFDNLSGNGQVQTYEYSESDASWNYLGDKIESSSFNDISGGDIAINHSGDLIAVGYPNVNGSGEQSGTTKIFKYNTNDASWNQVSVNIDGSSSGDHSGTTLAFDMCFNCLGISSPFAGNNSEGSVNIYNITDNSWEHFGNIDGLTANEQLGSIAMTPSAEVIAVGSKTAFDGAGVVRIYLKNTHLSNSFEKLSGDISGSTYTYNPTVQTETGSSIFLSEDGQIISVGEPGYNVGTNDNTGRVRVFDVSGIPQPDPGAWLYNYSTSNTLKSIYMKGMLEMDNAILRTRNEDDNLIGSVDASFNGGNVYLGETVKIGTETIKPDITLDVSGNTNISGNLKIIGDLSAISQINVDHVDISGDVITVGDTTNLTISSQNVTYDSELNITDGPLNVNKSKLSANAGKEVSGTHQSIATDLVMHVNPSIIYPKTTLTTTDTNTVNQLSGTITGETYGNGTYTITSDVDNSYTTSTPSVQYPPVNAFDNFTDVTNTNALYDATVTGESYGNGQYTIAVSPASYAAQHVLGIVYTNTGSTSGNNRLMVSTTGLCTLTFTFPESFVCGSITTGNNHSATTWSVDVYDNGSLVGNIYSGSVTTSSGHQTFTMNNPNNYSGNEIRVGMNNGTKMYYQNNYFHFETKALSVTTSTNLSVLYDNTIIDGSSNGLIIPSTNTPILTFTFPDSFILNNIYTANNNCAQTWVVKAFNGNTELEELYNSTVTITSGELNIPITNTNQVSANKYTLQLSNPASGTSFYQNTEFKFTNTDFFMTNDVFGADVSLNPALSVPGNILIVDSSNSEYNYGSYTIHTDKDYNNYFAVGKSASDVFNIVNNNNAGVYMSSSANSFTGTSDERLKKNIYDIQEKDLENLQHLRPVSYKWKKQTNDSEHYGFIAQEVEKYLPNLVDENTCPDGSTYKGVAVDDLIPYMIKYIQKLKKKIAEKEKEMET